jgi:hypothetical protein
MITMIAFSINIAIIDSMLQLVVQVAHGVGEPDKPRTDLLRTRDAGQLG